MTKISKVFLNDDGYTFIETFLMLLMLTLLLGVIFTNSTTISEFTLKAITELTNKNDILAFKLSLEEEAGKVVNPWFYNVYNIETEDKKLIFHYYEGQLDSLLTIGYGDDGISLIVNDETINSFESLKGEVTFEDGFIFYTDDNISLSFPLGVIID